MQWISKGEGGDSDGQYTSSKPLSSALLVSLPESSLRNIDTRSMFSSTRLKPLRRVDFGKQDPKSKLLVKTSSARRSAPVFLRPEQDVQYGEVSC